MNNGYIKLHRKMEDWEWYKDSNTFRLFIHLLFKANWEDSRYQGYEIPRGSCVVGRKQLASELAMSEQSVRTALDHLKSTNEITTRVTSKFTIVNIVKYSDYQEFNVTNQPTNQPTPQPTPQPSSNHQVTTSKKEKERKNINNNIALPFSEKFAEVWERWKTYRSEIKHKLPASTEISQLKKLSAYSEEEAIAMIEQSIENGWQGLFPIKKQKNDKSWMQMLQDYHSDQPQEEGEKDLW